MAVEVRDAISRIFRLRFMNNNYLADPSITSGRPLHLLLGIAQRLPDPARRALHRDKIPEILLLSTKRLG